MPRPLKQLDLWLSPVLLDVAGRTIGEGNILLFGQMYYEVTLVQGQLRIVHEHETVELRDYWCACCRIVGHDGYLDG
jgi:hypothetical protein